MGIIYQTAWLLYRDGDYAATAEELYLNGLEVSPDRPQFLYGLFDLYLSGGREKEALEVGKEIARLWPTDSSVRQRIQLLEAAQ